MPERTGPFGTMPQEPLHSGKGLNQIRYPTQLQGSVHPCKLQKQPEHGRT